MLETASRGQDHHTGMREGEEAGPEIEVAETIETEETGEDRQSTPEADLTQETEGEEEITGTIVETIGEIGTDPEIEEETILVTVTIEDATIPVTREETETNLEVVRTAETAHMIADLTPTEERSQLMTSVAVVDPDPSLTIEVENRQTTDQIETLEEDKNLDRHQDTQGTRATVKSTRMLRADKRDPCPQTTNQKANQLKTEMKDTTRRTEDQWRMVRELKNEFEDKNVYFIYLLDKKNRVE